MTIAKKLQFVYYITIERESQQDMKLRTSEVLTMLEGTGQKMVGKFDNRVGQGYIFPNHYQVTIK